MSIRCLNRLFQPRSVAVVGASPKKSSIGRIVLLNLVDEKFPGSVYPVNPKYDSIEGIPCLKGVDEIAESLDLAVVCTPAATVPGIVDACGRVGVLNVLILSAGFRELGGLGGLLEDEVRQVAAKYPPMRIVGPNCLGVLAPHNRFNASFARRLPKPGRTALVSQSGALCTAMIDWAIMEGIGLSAIASLGNALDVDIADMIDYLATDPFTDAIVLYLESIGDARKFMSAARAFTRTKPIVAYKAGRFAASAKAIASHTGAMAGEDSVCEAAMARAGIIRVHDMNELFSCAEVLARGNLPRGPRLAIVSNAGGPGIMATDALLSRQGTLATIAASTLETLNGQLPPAWSHQNPIDILGDASPADFGATVEALLQDDGVDGMIVLLTPQAMTDPEESASTVIAASAKSTKTVLAVWMGGVSVQSGIEKLNRAGIPTFQSPEQAVAAFERMVQYGHRREVLYETTKERAISFHLSHSERDSSVHAKSGMLNEIESKNILAAYDIPSNETLFAANALEAVAIAQRLNCPVALKVVSPDVSHKTNVGGVILNVRGEAEVAQAFETIRCSVSNSRPGARFLGVSVQSMVFDPKSVELILGAKRDSTFGSVLMVGIGGTMAELIRDRVIELPPLNDRSARRMLESMKAWPLIHGFRGRPRLNIDQLTDTLIRLSFLVTERPEIVELDINPLVVTQKNVIALDARVILDERVPRSSTIPYSHLAIRPYPDEWTREFHLANGRSVTLRPIRPEDEQSWIKLLEDCSPATIHDRFGGLVYPFNHQFAARFCFIDYDREMAIVAEIENQGARQLIGMAQLVAYADRDRASLALLVGDPWKRNGLATQLAQLCLEVAQTWNVSQVVAETTADNIPARAILHAHAFCEEVGADGVVLARRSLTTNP